MCLEFHWQKYMAMGCLLSLSLSLSLSLFRIPVFYQVANGVAQSLERRSLTGKLFLIYT